VLAALLTMGVMLAFRMPMLAVGPLLVFFGMQRDAFSTRVTLAGFLVVFVVVSVLLTVVTFVAWDAPWLRVPLFAVLFYAGFRAMWALPQPQLAVGPLVILALTSYAYDGIPNPNPIFDELGWLWAIFGVITLAILLSQWLIPPPSAVAFARADMRSYLAGLERRLLDRAFLRKSSGADVPGAPELLDVLHKTAMAKGITRAQLLRSQEIIAGAEGLMACAEQAARAEVFGACRAVRGFRLSLQGRNAATPPSLEEGVASAMHEALARFHDAISGKAEGVAPQAAAKADHHDFALRAALATMFCYLFMAGTDWNGIHTCMVTCIVTALPSSGARAAKRSLRVWGALAGGTFAFAAAIFVVPRLHDLGTFLILLGIASFIGAWVVRGHPRYSYVGIQFVLAVYLMLLQSPHAVTELEKTRDRWVGIVLGTITMWAAFEGFSSARIAQVGENKPGTAGQRVRPTPSG
jgi:multidrug resistance protein MdtO